MKKKATSKPAIKKIKRDNRLFVRISKENRRFLDKQAKKADMSLAEFVDATITRARTTA